MKMDEWGKDPSVRAQRKIFKEMEKSLDEIMRQLEIAPYDQRIKGWLEKALVKFEMSWGIAEQMGIIMDEKTAPLVYTHCLAKAIASDGIEIPETVLPQEKDTVRLVHEVFK